MVDNLKKPEADLRRYYILFLEIGLLATLTLFIAAFNLQIKSGERKIDFTGEKEVIQMEHVEQTEQHRLHHRDHQFRLQYPMMLLLRMIYWISMRN